MILLVDSSALALLINPDASAPLDPATNQIVSSAKQRVENLISSLDANDTIIVPTPVLAELLVKAEDAAPQLLSEISGQARLKVEAFDERAAVEVAMMTREAITAGSKRGESSEPWQKVKFDRQIIAIGRVSQVTTIYADDQGLVAFAKSLGMDVFSTWQLPLPEIVQDLFSNITEEYQLESPDPSPVPALPTSRRTVNSDDDQE